ncbi:hypothetical protein [Eubacterium xylanophilum]|uniref:hypothetical protein n=1 Tax=Eubacterium xylanophilum TaxID=39497 RepID=UPI00047BD5D2|nr:hypothetical protein [Eubacterium xylanophilum]
MNKIIARFAMIATIIPIMVGCGNEKSKVNKEDYDVVLESRTESREIVHDIIKLPLENEVGINNGFHLFDQLVIEKEGKPVVISRMENEKKDRMHFTVSELQDDGTWKTEDPKWNDACCGKDRYGALQFMFSPNNELYVLMVKQNFSNPILRHLSPDGETYDIDLGSVIKENPNRTLLGGKFIDNSRIALSLDVVSFSSESNLEKKKKPSNEDEYNNEKTLIQVFDITKAQIDKEKEFVFAEPRFYDLDLNGYIYNSEYDSIEVRKIGEKIPKKNIQCGLKTMEGETGMCFEFISDDKENAYLFSSKGILGGKLDSDKWDCILDKDDISIEKDELVKEIISKGMQSTGTDIMIKGKESDYDFYRLINYVGEKSSQKLLVHYHEKE